MAYGFRDRAFHFLWVDRAVGEYRSHAHAHVNDGADALVVDYIDNQSTHQQAAVIEDAMRGSPDIVVVSVAKAVGVG